MMINAMQLNATFDYGYEYQGNNGRLVVTPLTDRAYMTLTNALDMKRGGAPQGPAGTGKTETVKDLGKNLAYFVVVQNCSETLDHLNVGTMLTGLSMSGCWGCFDEFNLIRLDVLSVITTYINEILQAMKRGNGHCTIGELTYECQMTTGIFITFNPGYAGRSELPDNLAALFRPVAMMVPELFSISKILLMSEGFQKSDELAKKVVTIIQLMKDQLSKQSHYDFSMRAVKTILLAAGRIKRESPMLQEVQVVIKAIRDMNLPKFLAEDVLLFDNLFIDLFPDCEEPEVDTDELQIAIE
jgi:dynein heavy chain